MSQLKVFNDPFEGKYKLKDDLIPSTEQKERIELISKSGVVCLATHPSLIVDPSIDDTNIHPDNILMWSHYSDNHYGICLGLRKNAIIYKVNYAKEFPELDLNEEKLPLELQAFFILHRKHKSWAYENEYRAINADIQNGPLSCGRSYEIERIYFGLRTSKGEIDLIKNIASGRNINFYQAKLKSNNFDFEFIEI